MLAPADGEERQVGRLVVLGRYASSAAVMTAVRVVAGPDGEPCDPVEQSNTS